MKKLLVAFLFILSATLQCCDSKLLKADKRDNVLALIKKSGYEGEAHRVTTEDGYFLKIHRVLPKTNRTIKSKPVFLMHGMLATSADFLVTGPDAALGFLLSDRGYDVWLGNARGNKHSMNHKKFSNSSKQFWTFSWHEIGYYDLPVMIDYMLKVTGSSKTFYAGHSQGTTSLLVLLSTRPEYNEKIVEAHLMAPSAFRKKIPRLRTLMIGLRFLDSLEDYRYLELSNVLRFEDAVSKFLCRDDNAIMLRVCLRILSALVGNNQEELQIDTKILPILMDYLSTRISIMQLTHYYQNMINDKFQRFDFKEKNKKVYNSSKPPEYELKRVVVPLFLYHATEDVFTSMKGADFLAKSLPNVKKFCSLENWNHVDFVYGKNAREVLYQDIVQSFDSSS